MELTYNGQTLAAGKIVNHTVCPVADPNTGAILYHESKITIRRDAVTRPDGKSVTLSNG